MNLRYKGMLKIKMNELNSLLRQLQTYGNLYESNIGNSIAELPPAFIDILTKEIPVSLKPFFSEGEYNIKSAFGQGRVAQTPSISIISNKIGKSPTSGVYLVFLFSKDLSKIYFQLAIGVTKLKSKKITEIRDQIRNKLNIKDYSLLTQNNENFIIKKEYKDATIYGNIWNIDDDSYCINLVNQLTRLYGDYMVLLYPSNQNSELVKTKEPEINYNKFTLTPIEGEFKDLDNKNQQMSTNYWWLVANPKYFRFSDIEVGRTVDYTVKTDKGNPRRHAVNFENARKGDIVIGYEANPVKKIVSLLTVDRPSDGETILFKKIEDFMFPVGWLEFKDLPELKEMEFLKNRNGSFFKLNPSEYDILLNLIRQDNPEIEYNPIVKKKIFEKYTKEDFLKEVFLSEDELRNVINLLNHKQNIILQGAPGVGKTYTAKRLAYLMMGEKDSSRLEIVQFHQNFSYEDFIMGYKPTSEGSFELFEGKFIEFCRKAKENSNKDYFFIIDEINRGNLSKIFGELLMLIEKDYRGESIELAYNKKPFSVPKNLYLIGMMNTADRSLAMIDYALRRRFAFFPMSPGFDKDSFKDEITKSTEKRMLKVIEAIKKLNEEISKDDTLGDGFCIGHSYFCNPQSNEDWIENIVKYEICPMLDEYWFDNKTKAEEEKKKLLDQLK